MKKNNFTTKLFSFALITALLISCLSFGIVSAEGTDTNGKIAVDDNNNFFIIPVQSYTLGAKTKMNANTYSEAATYIAPKVESVPYDKQLTKTELSELSEALSNIDYENYELITGTDFEVKHIPLKYGYSLDIVSITKNDTLKKETTVIKAMSAQDTVPASVAVYIRKSTGEEIAKAKLDAIFRFNGTSVSIDYKNMFTSTNDNNYYYNNVSYSSTSGGGPMEMVYGRATANAPGITLVQSLEILCDKNGEVTTRTGN